MPMSARQVVHLIAAALLGATCVHAAPSSLDTTFNATGMVTTLVSAQPAGANAIVVQPDGKIVLAGSCDYTVVLAHFCALRYQSNGSLDTSFNGTGKIITAIGNNTDDIANAIALQPDGKIVLAGRCNGYFCALRYSVNGSLDLSFNATGTITTAIGDSDDGADALALQSDGKLVLAGRCFDSAHTHPSFCALRYNASGSLDLSFNGTGKVITPIDTAFARSEGAKAVAVQPDGKIVVAGYCHDGAQYAFCALRYNANGTLDAGFNGTGKVQTAIGLADNSPTALALQPDGKIVIAGTCAIGSYYDICALRYLPNGLLDVSFGVLGKIIPAINNYHFANAVALQPDGKLIVISSCLYADYLFCTRRYDPNGVLDNTFGTAGEAITTVRADTDNLSRAVALQADGKIVIAGDCGGLFCALRYDGGPFGYKGCSLDLDGDGRVLATTDSLIATRIALGMRGSVVTNGITFAANAKRNSWSLIRDFLVAECGMSPQL